MTGWVRLTKKTRCMRVFFVVISKNSQLLVFLIADVLGLGGVKGQVANGGNQAIDAKGNQGEEDVGAGSAGVSLRLEAGVIDNDTADPAQEERQKKAYQIFVIHFENSFHVCPQNMRKFVELTILFYTTLSYLSILFRIISYNICKR